MDRRNFLKNLGIVTAGIVAADQLVIIDKLGWKRRFFPGFTPKPRFLHASYGLGFSVSREMIEDDWYNGQIKKMLDRGEITIVSTPRNPKDFYEVITKPLTSSRRNGIL